MPDVAGTHDPGRGEGIEGLRGWLRYTITYRYLVVVVGVRDNAVWWKNTCSGKGRRIGQSMRVEYSEPLAAWIFIR